MKGITDNDLATIKILYYIFLSLQISVFVIWKWDFVRSTMDSSETSPSMKRFAVFFSLWATLNVFLGATFINVIPPDYMWYGILSIVLGGLGLMATQSIMGKGKPIVPDTPKDDTNTN